MQKKGGDGYLQVSSKPINTKLMKYEEIVREPRIEKL